MKDLETVRKKAGLTQDALAELAHTSQPQIDRLEKGKRQLTIAWAKRLAPHVNVNYLELLPIDVNEIKSHGRSKSDDGPGKNEPYHKAPIAMEHHDQEGEQMVLPEAVIAAIGMLTIEVAGLKAELKEIKATQGNARPGKARRK